MILPSKNVWDYIIPMWEKMNVNIMLSGFGNVNKMLMYAIATLAKKQEEDVETLKSEIQQLKDEIQNLKATIYNKNELSKSS